MVFDDSTIAERRRNTSRQHRRRRRRTEFAVADNCTTMRKLINIRAVLVREANLKRTKTCRCITQFTDTKLYYNIIM